MKCILLPLLMTFGVAASFAANPVPELVKDINTRPASDGARIQSPTAMGNTLFFTACDAAHGQELWKSDGTPRGTKLLKDVLPGFGSSFPRELTVVGDTLYFVADDFQHGFQLWKSDGTQDGTYLVKDLAGDTSALAPKSLTAAGNKLFFLLPTENGPDRLWTSDGTAEGTVEVLPDDTSVDSPHDLIAFKNTVVFVRGDSLYCSNGTAAGTTSLGTVTSLIFPDGTRRPLIVFKGIIVFRRGNSLYRSDGTAEGTVSLGLLDFLGYVQCFAGDDILYFVTEGGNKRLWKSDGTPGGTEFVSSLDWAIEEGAVLGNTLVFSMYNSDAGVELWCSDETGTRLLKDLAPGTQDDFPLESNPQNFTVMGNFVYFTATPGPNTELWRTDGTEAGTTLVIDRKDNNDPTGAWFDWRLGATKERLYFSNGAIDLWVTDGTAKGSRLLKRGSGASGNHYISRFTSGDDMMFFIASEQLWRTNGTKRGTIQLTGLRDRTASSNPSFERGSSIYPAGERTYFTAFDGVRMGLWTSRGTGRATYPVKYFNDWPTWDSSPISRFYPMGDRIFVVTNWEYHLLVSDGTFKGTRRLFTGLGSGWDPEWLGLEVIGTIEDVLYFTHAYGQFTGEIWKTDGTVRGTKRVRGASQVPLVSTANPATEMTLFFLRDGTLYRTDGTAEGTYAVNETGELGSELIRVGNQVYFSSEENGTSGFWCSDGTPGGTRRLLDRVASNPVVFKDKVFVFAGSGLWSTDGTLQGTQLVTEAGFANGAWPSPLFVAGNLVYFPRYVDKHHIQLWRSDGTAGGTSMVGTQNFPNLYYNGYDWGAPIVVGSILYFAASTEMEGRELWQTDGTSAGTRMVADLTGDSAGSDPYGFGLLGSQLLFWATTSARGRELYSLDVSADLAPPP